MPSREVIQLWDDRIELEGIRYSLKISLEGQRGDLDGNMSIRELYCWVVVMFCRRLDSEEEFLAGMDQFGDAARRLRSIDDCVVQTKGLPKEPPQARLSPERWDRLQRTRQHARTRSHNRTAWKP